MCAKHLLRTAAGDQTLQSSLSLCNAYYIAILNKNDDHHRSFELSLCVRRMLVKNQKISDQHIPELVVIVIIREAFNAPALTLIANRGSKGDYRCVA